MFLALFLQVPDIIIKKGLTASNLLSNIYLQTDQKNEETMKAIEIQKPRGPPFDLPQYKS